MPVPIEQLLPFLAGSILITVVPGADMALIMRQVFVGGTALAQRTIFGNLTGLVVHATALAVGLSALLVASAEAYTVVKLAGAAYLVYLGAQSLLSAWRAGREPRASSGAGAAGADGGSAGGTAIPADGYAAGAAEADTPVAARPGKRVPSMRTAYLQGVISTVLNPKPALLFLTFLPQFVDTTQPVLPQIMFLAGVHIVVGLIWLTIYAHLIHRAHRTLTRSDVRGWVEGATGVVLIALGLRVAVEPR